MVSAKLISIFHAVNFRLRKVRPQNFLENDVAFSCRKKKMNGVETKYWDASVNGGVPGDKEALKTGEECVDLLGILDFPMENLVEDETVGDWDISKSEFLGPIPSDGFLGYPPVSNVGQSLSNTMLHPEPNVPIGGNGELQESGSFQAHSPVSVLESSSSCSGGKWMPIRRTRSKRARRTSVNTWFVMSPISYAVASKKTSSSRKNKEKKKKLSQLSLSMKIMDDSLEQAEEFLHASDSTEMKETSLQRHVPTKKCTHCEVTKTPQWREGPNGPKTLCNACGVRYRSGRLFPEYRPAASPTFVPSLHSNSHKKVVEMRKKALQEIPIGHDPSLSPAPEFVPMNSSLFDLIY